MIGKAEWFQRRKYGGWGLTPKTKEGWLYALGMITPLIILGFFPIKESTLLIVSIGWILVIVADAIHIMLTMKKDERETQHEAIAERNALVGVLAVIIAKILYDVIQGALNETLQIDWWMMSALFVGVIIKAITNIYLDKNN